MSPDDAGVTAGDDPLNEVWARLARPFEVNATAGAVVGLPPLVVAQVVGLVVATSPEAERLLDRFPVTVRGLATSVHTHPERCIGSLRGPVLWSETISARGASFGDPDVFVCESPSRAYDVDANQVLVAALGAVYDSARRAGEGDEGIEPEDARLRRARHNGFRAGRFLHHPSLQAVTRGRPSRRAVQHTRSRRRRNYEPALGVLALLSEPLGPDDLRPWCDERTRAQLRVLVGVVARLEAAGGALPPFRAERGGLYAGPVRFFHPRATTDPGALSGIVVGSVLVDVPDRLHDPNRARALAALDARAGGRPAVVAMDEDDLDRAVELAITLATPKA